MALSAVCMAVGVARLSSMLRALPGPAQQPQDCRGYQEPSTAAHACTVSRALIVLLALHCCRFCAPEVLQHGGAAAGPAADMYSYGCLLLEMATGQPPYAYELEQAAASRRYPATGQAFMPGTPSATTAAPAAILPSSSHSSPFATFSHTTGPLPSYMPAVPTAAGAACSSSTQAQRCSSSSKAVWPADFDPSYQLLGRPPAVPYDVVRDELLVALVAWCTSSEPGCRPSAGQVLQHPYFARHLGRFPGHYSRGGAGRRDSGFSDVSSMF